MLYTEELNKELAKLNITIPENERQIHEAALAQGLFSTMPYVFPDFPVSSKLAFYNIPGIGPSIALLSTQKSGRHGTVTKHLASSGGDFAFKTVRIKTEEDKQYFEKEKFALAKRKLLKWYADPANKTDTGKLIFPYYDGIQLCEFLKYVDGSNGIVMDQFYIKLIQLILIKVRGVHQDGLIHRSLHDENILVDNVGCQFVVHLVDYGRSYPINFDRASPFNSEIKYLAKTFESIFNTSGRHVTSDAIIMNQLIVWMKQGMLKSMVFIENAFEFVRMLRFEESVGHRTKAELLDFIFLSFFIEDKNVLKKIVAQACEEYSPIILNEKNSENIDFVSFFSERKDGNQHINDIFDIIDDITASYSNATKSVLTFSADRGCRHEFLSRDEKVKFHFFY